MILKSELNAKNKITTFGPLAIPSLTKTSSKTCITWSLEKHKKLIGNVERCYAYKMPHPEADTDRQY
jgi:hypothetical protein